MKAKLNAFFITIPRWFAMPGVVCMVLLGGVLSGGITWVVWLAVISSLFLMAWGHGANTWLDYSWTGFDIGTSDKRSKPKTYTVGQQPIAAGILTPYETFWYSFIWLVLSGILAMIVCWKVDHLWVLLPWTLGALVTFGYSWGKLHYLCEFMLGAGFGPLAVMFGAAATPNPKMVTALIAGLPFFILWGYLAETIDQWTDADVNVPRGLRNMGALLWKNNVSVIGFLAFLLAVTYASQLFIVLAGILSPMTGLALISFLPLSYCLLHIGGVSAAQSKAVEIERYENICATIELKILQGAFDGVKVYGSSGKIKAEAEKNLKVGVIWGLVGIFLYALLLLVGQIIGG